MTLAMPPMSDLSAGRERASRVFAVAGILYGLIALITAGVAALGLFGFAGPIDPAAVEPARMLGLPWSLAITPATAATPTMLMLLACGAMVVNGALIGLAARLTRTAAR
jgi:hypothetical protein